MSKKRHTIDTDDYFDYTPAIRLAGCHGNGSSKVLEARIKFGTNPNEHPSTAEFVVTNHGEEVLKTYLFGEAIEKYNSLD